MDIHGVDIERIAHDCFRIRAGGKTIYFDPYNIQESDHADAILITHEHDDHLSLKDIRKVFTPDSTVVIPPVAHPPLLQLGQDIDTLIVMGPKEKYQAEGWSVETIPSYNINKYRSPGKLYHTPGDERLGFVLTIAGKRIYHAGDSDCIPEMASLEGIDIALLPVSGTFVMTPEEAVKAVEMIKPRVAVPMHWGSVIGSRKDAEEFKDKAGTEVVIV